MNRRAKQKLKARSKKKGKKPIGKGNFIYKFKKTKQQRKKNKITKFITNGISCPLQWRLKQPGKFCGGFVYTLPCC